MRKHNEGYALVLVLVVLIVLGLLSAVILTGAQRNLEVHRSGVETMQNKYQAMGEIEKIIGALETFSQEVDPIQLANANNGDVTLNYSRDKEDMGRNKTIYLTSICGNVQIDCTVILIDGVIDQDERIIAMSGYTCTSYEISTIGGAN